VVISVRRGDPPDWVGRVRRIADACYPERRSRLANPVTLYLSGARLGPPSGCHGDPIFSITPLLVDFYLSQFKY